MEILLDEHWNTDDAQHKTPWQPTDESNHYIIGYFAYEESVPKAALYHDESVAALIVCSNPDILRKFVERFWVENAKGYVYKKLLFGQIMYSLINGISLAFDKQSYAKFLPLLKKVLGKDYNRVHDADFYDEETLILYSLKPEVDYMSFKEK